MGSPTLTEIEDSTWDHLARNATAWTDLANTWEAAFTEIRDAAACPGGVPWTGTGAQAFQHRAAADVVAAHEPADMLRSAAQIATRGVQAQQYNKSLVLSAVHTAEREGFRVGDDYSVTDTWTYYSSAAEQAQRQRAAEGHASFITSRAANLVNNEHGIARQLTAATAGLHEFRFGDEGADGGAGSNGLPHAPEPAGSDPAELARQRDQAIADDPAADPSARRLAQARLDDLRNSEFIGPLPADPVLGGDARTRAQSRRQFQEYLESGQAYPDRPPLTPDQATQMLDRCESQAREFVLHGFANQLESAGVSPAGIQRALDEVRSGKSPGELIHEAGSDISSGVGSLGSGLSAQANALPQGKHWGDAQVWSEADVNALKTLGRKLSIAGFGLDALLTGDNIALGAAPGEELAKLGGRSLGSWLGGFAAGAMGGSAIGPEGALIFGLLGAVAGGLGGEKTVNWMMGN